MLYSDNPCRIWSPGTFQIMDGANYTVGADFVFPAVQKLLERTNGDIACDIETFGLGLNARRLKCVCFSDDTHAIICDPRDPGQAQLIRDTFAQATSLLWHNSPYDLPNLYMNDLIRLEDISKTWDTLIWARSADPGETVPKNLEDACARYLKAPKLRALVKAFRALGLSKKDGYFEFDLDRPIYLQGAAFDPLLTYRLRPVVRQAAYDRMTSGHPFWKRSVQGEEAWALVDREQRLNRIALKRACLGYRVDFEYLENFKDKHGAEMHRQEKQLEEKGIRPGVGQDLIKFLDEKGELPPDHPKTETGLFSANQKALAGISHPVAKAFRDLKEVTKVQNDYLEKVVELADKNGRIHPTTNFLAAAHGRSSMGDPPIHQFPGPARGIILFEEGDPGCSLDWVQQEPITIGNIARDTKFIPDYEAGGDTYISLGVGAGMLPAGVTTDDCAYTVNPAFHSVRSTLKIVLLARMYGEGLKKLTADLGLAPGPYHPANAWEVENMGVAEGTMMPDYAAARSLQASVDKAMPKTAALIMNLKGIARQHRKIITISGRVLDIPSGMYNGRWSVQSHKGPNFMTCGSAYDMLADTMIRCEDAGLADAIQFNMHDELVVSQSAAHDIRKIMETPPDRLCEWAGRVPILRTDRDDFEKVGGKRWQKA